MIWKEHHDDNKIDRKKSNSLFILKYHSDFKYFLSCIIIFRNIFNKLI